MGYELQRNETHSSYQGTCCVMLFLCSRLTLPPPIIIIILQYTWRMGRMLRRPKEEEFSLYMFQRSKCQNFDLHVLFILNQLTTSKSIHGMWLVSFRSSLGTFKRALRSICISWLELRSFSLQLKCKSEESPMKSKTQHDKANVLITKTSLRMEEKHLPLQS